MKSIAGLAAFAGFLYMALVVPLVDAGFIELTVEDKTNHIEFNGMLRYKIELGPHLEFEYRHCYLNSASIPKFKPGVGSWGVCDPAIKNRPGLYFPDGYNSSTVIRAYDSYISRFYDCARTDSSQDAVDRFQWYLKEVFRHRHHRRL
ncbi:hypothetical protein BGW42_003578 [Actinomortierella wolfii]|nr:hypothetical protein BGW42_003578 [Actinomortierella wolfii]